ncbi:MFS transporter [Musicola keenii]|uniref:MFS transporter n=1 Tax=Musicola keenii TaxID=2884250 RepID=UPI0017865A1B|nr:MFS transporter [Musicola keenii]
MPAVIFSPARRTLVASVLVLFLAAMDSTIISTALPAIRLDIGASGNWPWVMSGFLLPMALIAPLAGAYADRLGITATLKGFLLLFLSASALAARCPNLDWLVGARVLQGAGAGGLVVLVYTLLAQLFSAEQRGKMQGMLSAVWGIAAISGPLIGGVLTQTFGWRSVFWINLPIGLFALGLLFTLNAPARPLQRHPIDAGAHVVLAMFSYGVIGVLQALNHSHTQVLPLACLCVGGILMKRQLQRTPHRSPLPVDFFQRADLLAVVVLVILSSAAIYATVTLLPMALARHAVTPISGGLLIMVAAMSWVCGSIVCGRLLTTQGYRKLAIAGMVLLMTGALMLAAILSAGNLFAVIPALFLIGIGTGLVATVTLVFAQNAAPVNRLGSWTSMIQFLRNLGSAAGINLLAAVQQQTSASYSFTLCFLLLAGLMLLGIIPGYFMPASRDGIRATGTEP